ncbi:MAG: glycosyltransferase family 2 protein [Desulfobulbaceae bacterium]
MKITVITVSLNNAATIGDTIRSVRSQTFPDREHILIDGGSTDGTVEIIRSHGDHIADWISEPDRGIYDAMNKGLDRATGEVIGFLNADDVYADREVLTDMAEAFTDPGIEGCYSDLVYVRQDDLDRVVRYWRSAPFRPGRFARGWCPPHPTFYVRKEVYDRYGGYDLDFSIGNDIELMMRFLEKYRIRTRYIPRTTVKMRMGGTSNQTLGNIFRQNVEILRAARKNGLAVHPLVFTWCKLVSRAGQFLRRPAEGG